jgi:MFS family permease
MPGVLDKARIVAPPGYNRWLVIPAALAIHLCIGMAYGFSVFWLPLAQSVGVTAPVACPADMPFFDRVFTTTCDWSVEMLGWVYTLFFVFLGGAAAVFGRWVERVGPRKAGVAAACCWSGGLAIAALGVYLHQIVLLWLGAGAIGGVGLGLGYISPVSTLLKWFPDRRGLATGFAIMGFGGGAMIGAPLADRLMGVFANSQSVGVWQTFLCLAAIYFVAMMSGAFGYRLPAPGWTPARVASNSDPSRENAPALFVPVNVAMRTPQFWLLWGMLCLNVSAGIGVIGMASPMLQEVFGGRLIGDDAPLANLDKADRARVATIGAAFAGLLSLCNILGRLGWASASDWLGRKATYTVFFLAGAALYAAVPSAGQAGSVAFFVLFLCLILTLYGGGFATIPAYLADVFGPHHISAIHGRLLTAWSAAGILGPVTVNYIRAWQLERGVPAAEAYTITLYVLAGLLIGGLLCNSLVRPVPARRFEPVDRFETKPIAESHSKSPMPVSQNHGIRTRIALATAWIAVGLPLLWGVCITLDKARVLFR